LRRSGVGLEAADDRRRWPSSPDASLLDGGDAPDQGDAAAGDDALLDGRPRGVERVVDAVLLLLELGLGGGAHLDHGDAALETGQALLELLLVVVARGLLHEAADLGAAGLDVLLGPGALDDGRDVLRDRDALRPAEVLDRVLRRPEPQRGRVETECGDRVGSEEREAVLARIGFVSDPADRR
jgi:hypothetical protein